MATLSSRRHSGAAQQKPESIIADRGGSGAHNDVDFEPDLPAAATENDAERWNRFSENIKQDPGFTETCNVDRLVRYETCQTVLDAIAREKTLKKWRRDWKIRLIGDFKPDWSDLYQTSSKPHHGD